MENVLHWVNDYGYVAIFLLLFLGIVGLPIPDETMLTFAGYMVYKGSLDFLPTVLTAFVGAMSGITASYLLGRLPGLYVLMKYGRYVRITEAKLERCHQWYRRVGKWSLTFGYFIPAVRHFTALVAGSSKLEYPVFAVYA
jgi:membrane protein DedA with SNARE-associated domain